MMQKRQASTVIASTCRDGNDGWLDRNRANTPCREVPASVIHAMRLWSLTLRKLTYQKFLGTNIVIPLTWQEKGYLALNNLANPANFGTIVGISAISVAADPDSAYGPGLKGFGKSVGISYVQDVTGLFFGAFAFPVLFHQDPRYFHMPNAPLGKRILYSVSRTVVSRHDDGRSMPNYSVLLSYPVDSVLANRYVPG